MDAEWQSLCCLLSWKKEGYWFHEVNWATDQIKVDDIRLATEAALFASLTESGIPKHLGVHEERHYRKLVPFNEAARTAIEEVREEIWDLYRGLQAYKIAPSESLKLILSQSFHDLFFKKKPISPALNHLLSKTYDKKDELLRVLERPVVSLGSPSGII